MKGPNWHLLMKLLGLIVSSGRYRPKHADVTEALLGLGFVQDIGGEYLVTEHGRRVHAYYRRLQ